MEKMAVKDKPLQKPRQLRCHKIGGVSANGWRNPFTWPPCLLYLCKLLIMAGIRADLSFMTKYPLQPWFDIVKQSQPGELGMVGLYQTMKRRTETRAVQMQILGESGYRRIRKQFWGLQMCHRWDASHEKLALRANVVGEKQRWYQ